jgi:hypothetical protein
MVTISCISIPAIPLHGVCLAAAAQLLCLCRGDNWLQQHTCYVPACSALDAAGLSGWVDQMLWVLALAASSAQVLTAQVM